VLRNKTRFQFIFLVAALLLISAVFPLASSMADGTRTWVFETQSAVKASPVVGSDGTIYAGYGTGKWVFETENPVESRPAIGADGTIYLCTSDKLYAVNPDGTVKWTFEAGGVGSLNGTPALCEDGTIYVGGWGKVYALNPDGTEKWVCETGDLMSTSPAVALDGTIYAGSDDGNIYAIAGASGSVRATRDVPFARTDDPDVDVGGQSATLQGLINPNGEETTYWFEWGYSTGYGNTTTAATLPDTTAAFYAVSASYRVVAQNASGTDYGEDRSFIATEDAFLGLGANCFISTATPLSHTLPAPLLLLILLPAILFAMFWQKRSRKID